MRVDRSRAFDEERTRFALKFCCEDCGHFDAARAACRHEWPIELHRTARYSDEQPDGKVDFCKEFELC